MRAIKSRIIHIGSAGPGRVGVVPLGLADGYGSIRSRVSGHALLAGRRVPIRGVSLEYISLELDGFGRARVGDEVVLLGRRGDAEIGLEQLASWQGAKTHEVRMRFEGRLPARYLADGFGVD